MPGGMRRFEGRVVVVVGGGADGPGRPGDEVPMGNGRAIAMRLAEEGAAVAVTDLDLGRAQETVGVLAGSGLAIAADTADPAKHALAGSFLSFFFVFARGESAIVARGLIWYAVVPYLLVTALTMRGRRKKGRI